MSSEGDHRRWRAELAPYLLGALEPDEVEALERHLQGCERCRDELRWLQPAVDVLPQSVPQLDPPPALRERLLAEVRADAAAARAEERGGARPAPQARRRWGLRGFLMRPAVALTAVALLGALIGGYALRGGGGGASTTTTSTIVPGGIRVTLERSGDSGTLELAGLRRLGPGRVYQAWVQRGGRIEPSSLFDARSDGTASAAIPHQLDGADRVMVSVEPRGGSRQPTTDPIVAVALPE